MSSSTNHRITTLALSVGLLFLVTYTGLRKIRAPDYWWHLSTGRWMVDNLRVPHSDVFTYTVQGAPYLDAHWLFQLALYGIHSLGGHPGVVVGKTLLVVTLVAILATIGWRRERVFPTALGLGLVLLAANDRLLARPELTSFVLLAAIFALLERDTRVNDRWLFCIVPLQVLWANSHGLFALGVVICGVYTVGAGVQWLTGKGHARLLQLTILTLLVIACSFVGPNGIAGAIYPFEQLGMISPTGAADTARFSIGELIPLWQPGLRLGAYAPAIVLALLCAIALLANARKNSNAFEHTLLFVAFFGLFTIANRNAAIFAVIAGPLLVRNANEIFDRHPGSQRFDRLSSVVVVAFLLIATWDLARGSFYSRNDGYHEAGLGYIDLFVAEGAVDWIDRERPPGRIAHSIVLGGYLNWRLHPSYEVMVDGRLEVYGAKRLSELALRTPAAFTRLDAQYSFGSVVLTSAFDSPHLIAWLQASPEWRLVQADTPAVLFVRATSDNQSRWPALDVHSPEFLPESQWHLPITRGAHERARERLLLALGSKRAAGRRTPNRSGRAEY